MGSEVSDRVRTLASERDVAESAIIQEAVEAGLETLWRDHVIRQYLDGEVSRADAVEELGEDVVRDVERARDAVDADVEWGLHGADSWCGSVVADAGPIIHLAEADALGLLELFDELYVPQTVYDELSAGGVPDGFDALDARVREPEPLDRSSLDPGEAAAIALCDELAAVLLTDDMEARAVAETEGIEVHGSIGVVMYAYGEGALPSESTEASIRNLERESSLYLSRPLVAYALRVIKGSDGGW